MRWRGVSGPRRAGRLPGGAWLRAVASVLLLAAIVAWIRPSSLRETVEAVSAPWLVLALLLAVPQLLLSAWRWRLTARLLGVPLPMRRAVSEYCLGNFLNQVVPGGIAGDATRAWRHARTEVSAREAWHAVVIERAAGQFVLLACAVLSLPLAPPLREGLRDWLARGASAAAPIAAVAAVLAVLAARRAGPALARFSRDLGRALLGRSAWPRQLLVSLALLCSYVAVYLCCARALGVQASALTLAPLVCWVLLAMALPISLAGWGIREGAAAAVWLLAGLPAAQGVAVSLLYGVVVLVSALPGAWILLGGGATPAGRGGLASGEPG
jgi:uncharacterized membrane protein YbhN (UPF0104 family)